MKKIFLLIPFICVAVLFTGCQKKDRLNYNTMIVSVEIDGKGAFDNVDVALNSSITLTAVIRDASGALVTPESVLWSVSNDTVGTISKSSSITTQFVALNTGSTTITLSYLRMEKIVVVTVK